MSKRQELIDAIEAKVAAGRDVVASAVALMTGFVEAVREAADDEEELEAVLQSITEQTDTLAAAVATVPTEQPAPADDEPAQTGGEDSGEGAAAGTDTAAGGEGADTVTGGEVGDPEAEQA